MSPWLELILLLCLLIGSASRAAEAPQQRPPMFAAYYVWYSTADGPHGRWSGWGTRKKPDLLASAAEPLVGRYDSDDREVVRWHMRLAKAAGIDAFLVSWWGPGTWQDVPRLTETAFEKAVLPVAAEEEFNVALIDETTQFHRDLDEVKRWAAQYLAKYKDNPAYLRIDGKPVYHVYQTSLNPRLTPEAYRELVRHVEAEVGPVYWILDKIGNADDRFRIPQPWLKLGGGDGAVDAFTFYSTFSNFRTWRYKDLIDRYRGVVRAAHASGAKMMVPVHPGHDNSRLRPDDFFFMPRDNGNTLRGYLRAAVDSGADYVLLTSWNEWPETTVVEPAATWDDPYLYLKTLAEFNGVEFRPPPDPPPRRR